MRPNRAFVALTTGLLFVLIVPFAAQAGSVPGGIHSATSPGTASFSAVFTMTNNATANSVVAFHVGYAGALISAGTFSTHGRGTGTSLADQGALALTADHRWLVVVDAGSNQLSVFHVSVPSPATPLLRLTDRVSSGGVEPVSVAIHGSWVYALNVGNATTAGNIAGFHLSPTGTLSALPGSHRALSASSATGAAQVSFSPSGAILSVTEKATSRIDTFTVGPHGYAHGPILAASNGSTPYGFAFTPNGHLVVSDAGPGALSSYSISSAGKVSVVSGNVTDNQSAPCWVVVAEGGKYAYTSNAHSASISTYSVAKNGVLVLTASIGGSTGTAPTDMAVTTSTGHYLLVYDAGTHEIDEFSLGAGGSLTKIASVYTLPATAEGLIAF